MSSRLRERRRKENRTPGIWRGALAPTETAERPAVQHGTRGRVFVSWRVFSAMIVICLSAVLLLFFSSDAFYIHSISVGGLKYLSKEEIFTFANIANMHVFWLDPEEVRRNILREPTIADATVFIGWPPDTVQIIIEEREPALIWVENGIAVWVDLQGRKMSLREDRTDLRRVVVDGSKEEVTEGLQVPTDTVSGALQLLELVPDVTMLRYNLTDGLGYQSPNGWMVWFGTGTDMSMKYLAYRAIEQNLQGRGRVPFEINVSNVASPYYCVENAPCAFQP